MKPSQSSLTSLTLDTNSFELITEAIPQGKIGVESAVGKGVKFYFTLPIKKGKVEE